MSNLKFLCLILFSLSSNIANAQRNCREAELAKLFLQLPIDSSLNTLTRSAMQDSIIKRDTVLYGDEFLHGSFARHPAFSLDAGKYEIIMSVSNKRNTSDTFLNVAINAYYGDTMRRSIKKQYKKFVSAFKPVSAKHKKYSYYAYGKAGEVFVFYRHKQDRDPYLSIIMDYGGCITNYSITVNYQRFFPKNFTNP